MKTVIINKSESETKYMERVLTPDNLERFKDIAILSGYKTNKTKTGFWTVDLYGRFIFLTLKENE